MHYICKKMAEAIVILHTGRRLSRLLLAIVFLLSPHLPIGADTVDSLYHIYLNADKSRKTGIANEISRQLHADGIIDSLYQCSTSSKADYVEGLTQYLMAEYYYDQGQYNDALEKGSQARTRLSGFKSDRLMSNVLGVVSNAQFRIGDLDEALKTLLEAYELDKKLNDKELISSDLNSLAAIYLAAEQPTQGLSFIEKSIAIERELNRPDRIATRLGIASELYLLNQEPDKAMTAIDEAYRLDHGAGRVEKAAVRLVQKAAVLQHLSKNDEARHAINQALPILEKASNNFSLAVAYNQLGDIEGQEGKRDEAVACYKKALDLSIKCGSFKTELTAERGLWETMRESNPALALIHLERFAVLNDSLQLEKACIKYKVMEATSHIEELAELDQKSKRINHLMKWGGFALFVMLMGMLAGLYYSWRKSKSALKMQQQAMQMKSHFFTNITNKLQTPLTVVLGAGEQLLENRKTSAAENKHLGELIVNHGQNMLSLVNQMLDIQHVKETTKPTDYKSGDIIMFVRMLVDNHTEEAHQRMINLEFHSPIKTMIVEFAPEYLRKITHNLINNALTYTPRNGHVSVMLSSPEENMMRLIVSDTGKGIPADEFDRIFEPFTQSSNGDDGVATSLELSLVNMLVQAMHGSIKVDSEVGKGTTFTIDFPALIDESTAGIQEFAEKRVRRTEKTGQRSLVFIVENNEDVAFFIAAHLGEKYNLRFARDGREALQNAQNMVPDLIITNIKMPVIDGKELIAQVRQNPTLNHIPVIAMTSSMRDLERMACYEIGADNVLVKPFNSTELRVLVDKLITERSSLREHYAKSGSAISGETPSAAMSKEDKEFINKLADIIRAHMTSEDTNMEHIAAAMSLSTKQLRTRVMAITGLTPVAYVLQVRLNYARHMIASEGTSLTAIASKCGFQNLSHFSKAFKQQFGVSPLQFRKIVDNNGLPPNKI